jgi:hypothetical protein
MKNIIGAKSSEQSMYSNRSAIYNLFITSLKKAEKLLDINYDSDKISYNKKRGGAHYKFYYQLEDLVLYVNDNKVETQVDASAYDYNRYRDINDTKSLIQKVYTVSAIDEKNFDRVAIEYLTSIVEEAAKRQKEYRDSLGKKKVLDDD